MSHRLAASWILLFGVCVFAAAHAEAGGISNSCTDPYWQNTLRCKVLGFLNPVPMPPPQPTPQPPATVQGIRDYTRVELTDPDVRCVDGTRPILYIDKAVGAPSNRWLIVTTGGEFCAAQDLDDDGDFEGGNDCARAYLEQHAQQMGSAAEPAMSDLVDPDGSGNGVLNPDPGVNPVFARYHRVRVHKCGFDRHSGRATHPGVTATVPNGGPSFSYDLYNHGQKIVLAALDALNAGGAGLQYTTWIDVGGTVTAVTESLPSIAAAEQVVLVGHSAAAHGLYQNADRYAEHLRAMPGFNGDVRAVHDAQFQPSAENEAAFDPAQNPGPLLRNTLFDQRRTGTTSAIGNYDAYHYYGRPESPFAEDYRAWLESPGAYADVLDASCVAAHTPSDDVWVCADRLHVRLHHQSTSALLREDITDPNLDHTNLPWGQVMWWGQYAAYTHCDGIDDDLFAFSPCPPTVPLAASRERLLVQATHFREGIFTMAENVLNADPTDDPGSIYLWMPDCRYHDGIYDDPQFFETSIAADGELTSYRQFLQDFVAAPASGALVTRVHGLDGAVSECAPLLLRDSFE